MGKVSTAKIRGTAILGTLDFVRETWGEGEVSRVLEALSPATRELVAGSVPVTPDGWYDTRVVAELTRAADRAFGSGDLALGRSIGRFVAFRDVNRVFRWLYRLSGPDLIFSRFGRVWRTYYSDGRYVFEGVRGRSAALRIEDWAGADPAICRRVEGWIERTLELTLRDEPRPRIREEVHLMVDMVEPGTKPRRYCRFVADWSA